MFLSVYGFFYQALNNLKKNNKKVIKVIWIKIFIKFCLTLKYTKVLRHLISLLFSLTKVRVKVHSSFRFVRGLFVIYGTFPRLIRRKHEQTTNKRRARLLKDCFLSATYLVKFLSRKKKMHPTKNPNLRWGFLRNYIRKTMLLLFQQHVFSRGLVVHWQEPIGSR